MVWVLLDGGSSRFFSQPDAVLLEEDLNILKVQSVNPTKALVVQDLLLLSFLTALTCLLYNTKGILYG